MDNGQGTPHGRSDRHSRTAVISFEYFFITRGVVKRRSEPEKPQDEDGDALLATARKACENVQCLLIRGSSSQCVFPHVFSCKIVDADDYLVHLVIQGLLLARMHVCYLEGG